MILLHKEAGFPVYSIMEQQSGRIVGKVEEVAGGTWDYFSYVRGPGYYGFNKQGYAESFLQAVRILWRNRDYD